MKLNDAVRTSLKALRRRKFRTFLTTFAVFIGVFIIIVLVSLSFGAQKILLSQITNQFDLKSIFVLKTGTLDVSLFSTVAKDEEENKARIIDNAALSDIKALPFTEIVEPVIAYQTRKFEFIDKDFDKRVVESARGAGWNLSENDAVYGRVLAGRISNLANNEIIITDTLSGAYGKSIEDYLGQKIKLTYQLGLLGSQVKPSEPKEFTIAGVVENIRDYTYITSIDTALDDLYTRNNYSSKDEYIETAGFQAVYVKAVSEDKVKEIAKSIKELGFDATTLEDVLTVFNTFFSIIPIIFTIVGLIAIFVAAVGIINTMIMSVYERTKVIGVMKSVGAKNSDILTLFIFEAGFIGFFGGLAAVVVSTVLMELVNKTLVENVLPKLEITGIDRIFITPWELVAVAIIFSTIVGVLAGIYPAFRASRLNPVESLKHE